MNEKFRDGEKWQETEQNKETDFIKKFKPKHRSIFKINFHEIETFHFIKIQTFSVRFRCLLFKRDCAKKNKNCRKELSFCNKL